MDNLDKKGNAETTNVPITEKIKTQENPKAEHPNVIPKSDGQEPSDIIII